MDRAVQLAPLDGNGGILELPRRALIAWLVLAAGCRNASPRASGDVVPGDGAAAPRVTVAVLNASGRPGLARLGTRVLRDAGIDVLSFGNSGEAKTPLDSTKILVRRGPASVGERIRRALKVGKVVMDPDSTLLLDASVLLGADFAPRLPLHP
ncbi:MAG TPA: LytR C-terminal domain-containing protein [Gemmatimonadales bacterium]|nr:LytR C-terminal domain-containing protein [Gemmatimonadales bacterium]